MKLNPAGTPAWRSDRCSQAQQNKIEDMIEDLDIDLPRAMELIGHNRNEKLWNLNKGEASDLITSLEDLY